MFLKASVCLAAAGFSVAAIIGCTGAHAQDATNGTVDWSHAEIVVKQIPPAHPRNAEEAAPGVLVEEIQRRTGITLKLTTKWPESGPAIGLMAGSGKSLQGVAAPLADKKPKAESFVLFADTSHRDHAVLWINGADARGELFGTGKLLRTATLRTGQFTTSADLSIESAPEQPIRGHQLGYRATANSYDAWMPEQFDRYIRELALFGTNAIEGIPMHDDRPTVSGFPRDKMNVEISKICQKYGQDYWIWAPADFDLTKADQRAKVLAEHEQIYKSCPELTGVFLPGGDPGDNPPSLVIPFMRDMAKLLTKYHPKARVWLSLQGFSLEHQEQVYAWLVRERPNWIGGIAAGPGSPPLQELRKAVPKQYMIRDYPDITHSCRCQFPVPFWDPAFGFTLGRECYNPRPIFYSRVIHDNAGFTNGFISYSDGVHDDVNKVLWSALAWNSAQSVNDILSEYARLFFGPDVAETAASGLLAFEKDWEGPAATNGGIDGTYALWTGLDAKHPELKSNWRWQLTQLRANYDYYVRKRLIYETGLEENANRALLNAGKLGSDPAISSALTAYSMADTARIETAVSARIEKLCDDLFHSIGLQTSEKKYQASGAERGCVLDFLYYPLNNRLWVEDQLKLAKALPSEKEKVARLAELATWENPGPGSYYDSLGNVAKSPHEVRNDKIAAPLLDVDNMNLPTQMFWVGNSQQARLRHALFTYEGWPVALKYPNIDPKADYVIRTSGVGDCLLRVNGTRVAPTAGKNGRNLGDIKEFVIPRLLYQDGQMNLTFDATFEPELNWRVQSRISELWVIKK